MISPRLIIISILISLFIYLILMYNHKKGKMITTITDTVFASFILMNMLSSFIYIIPLLEICEVFSKSSFVEIFYMVLSVFIPFITIFLSKKVFDGIMGYIKRNKKIEVKEILAAYAVSIIVAFFSILIYTFKQREKNAELIKYTISPLCLLLSTFIPLEISFSKDNVGKEIKNILRSIFTDCRKGWVILSLLFSILFAACFNCPKLINESHLISFSIGFNIPPLLIIIIKTIIQHSQHKEKS